MPLFVPRGKTARSADIQERLISRLPQAGERYWEAEILQPPQVSLSACGLRHRVPQFLKPRLRCLRQRLQADTPAGCGIHILRFCVRQEERLPFRWKIREASRQQLPQVFPAWCFSALLFLKPPVPKTSVPSRLRFCSAGNAGARGFQRVLSEAGGEPRLRRTRRQKNRKTASKRCRADRRRKTAGVPIPAFWKIQSTALPQLK